MNTTVPSKNTGDTLSATELNNIVEAVNSKADIDPATGHVALNELPGINFNAQDFVGDASSVNPISLNFAAFQAWLISLPNYASNNVLYGDFTWRIPYTGTETQVDTPTGLVASLSPAPVSLSWTLISGNTYTIQRSNNNFVSSWITVGIVTNSGTFTDTTTVSGTTYQYRIKASLAGYIDSNYISISITTGGTTTTTTGSTTTSSTTPPTTTTTTEGPILNPLVTWPTIYFMDQTDNNLTYDDPSDSNNASALPDGFFPSGGIALVQFQAQPFTLPGEGATGVLGLALNTNPYGEANMLLSIDRQSNGAVIGRFNSGDYWSTSAGALSNDSGFMRLRTDGTNVYAEYSNDEISWIIGKQITQPAGLLYIQVSISGASGGNQRRVGNIQGRGLTAY